MSQTNKCPECGAELPPSAPRGLCPACLLKRGLETNTLGYSGPATAPAPASHWTPPDVADLASRFPELEITRIIGRGGMGAVYQARQKSLDRVVALKILPPDLAHDPAFAERFTREAQAMARLNHPHIVTIHEFGERAGWYYFIMEYVDGVNLRGLLDAGHVSPKEALAIVPQICEALQYAHEQGIVHRDIKPENILLSKQGQVKIADFGLAKLMGRSTPAVEKIMGTPQYMAPEQLDHPSEVDHRADIYSLGVVFYQMLTGELPTGQFAPPSRKVHIDVRLDEIVLRALEREPEKRYQQVSEVKTQVETIATTPAVAAVTTDSQTWRSPTAGWGYMVGQLFGITFTSPLAFKLANLSALGFLSGLAFLDSVPLPGMHFFRPFLGFAGFFGLIGFAYIVEGIHRHKMKRAPTTRDANSPTSPPPLTDDSASSRFPSNAIVAAMTTVAFFAAMTLGTTVVWALHRGGQLHFVVFAVSLLATPFIALLASRWVQRWQASAPRGASSEGWEWIKAWEWTAWILAIPAVGFGLFFLNALLSMGGPWHPATDEALMVPLTWLGAILLPASAWVLMRSTSTNPWAPRKAANAFFVIALGSLVLGVLGYTVVAGFAGSRHPRPAEQAALHIRLEQAEKMLTRVLALQAQGAASLSEVRKAKLERDLAAAELAGDPVAAALVRMQAAQEEMQEYAKLQGAGAASTSDVEEAALSYELAKVQFDAALRTARSAQPEPPATQPTTFPHLVHFEQGTTDFLDGDRITITEIRGTADTMEPGNTYKITGTYTLVSHERAMLAAYTTASGPDNGARTLPAQTTFVNKGDGTFTLIFPMTRQGWPHISFYPTDRGGSFGETYFGTGQSTKRPPEPPTTQRTPR